MRKLSQRNWIIGFVIFIALIVLRSPIKSVLSALVEAPSRTGTNVAQDTRSIIDLIRSIRDLHQINSDLKEENLRLQGELATLKEVRHENELLKKELGFSQAEQERFDFIPAKIMSRSPSTFLQSVRIDRGARDGIRVDQAVISQGYLVGRVLEVTETTSTIQLITASRSRIPIILNDSRATGLLQGGLSGLTGDDLPTNTLIQPGEGIVTSGIGDIVPSGIPIGSVEEVVSGSTDIVQRIQIYSPIEFGKLETVLILQPK